MEGAESVDQPYDLVVLSIMKPSLCPKNLLTIQWWELRLVMDNSSWFMMPSVITLKLGWSGSMSWEFMGFPMGFPGKWMAVPKETRWFITKLRFTEAGCVVHLNPADAVSHQVSHNHRFYQQPIHQPLQNPRTFRFGNWCNLQTHS